jgi:hypothetical protein
MNYNDIKDMVDGDMYVWGDVMKAYRCSGKHLEIAQRLMGAIVEDDDFFGGRFSERDKVNLLLKMIFDVGFQAGMSVDDKVKASNPNHNHRLKLETPT